MSAPTLPCPKCGNKIWQGPRYVPPVKAITQWSEVLRPAEDDQLSYTCTDCRFVRYEAPLDRKPVVSMQTSVGRLEMGPEWPKSDDHAYVSLGIDQCGQCGGSRKDHL